MIQRIQSVYLLLAAIAMGVSAFVPFLTVDAGIAQSQLLADSVFNADDHNLLSTLIGVVSGIIVVAIFLFSNRKRQMLLSLIAVLISVGVVGFGAYLWMGDQENLQGAAVGVGAGLFLPLVSIILLLLARRSIKKDEKLVRSSDRLR